MTAAEIATRAEDLLGRILEHMGVDVRVLVRLEDQAVTLELEGPDVDMVIGKQGRTLDALQQFLVRALLRDGGAGILITVDAEGYRARRTETLQELAVRAARDALASGRPARIANLTARERRIVHSAAGEVQGVRSYSEGEGDDRVLIIEPTES